MDKKAYFRGIGAGIIVAAVIMGVAGKNNRMSDSEILKRAQEIQNNQSVVLTENVPDNSDNKDSDNNNEIIKEIPAKNISDTQASADKSDSSNNNEEVSKVEDTGEEKIEDTGTEAGEQTASADTGDNKSDVKETAADDKKAETSNEDKSSTEKSNEETTSGELKEPVKINPMPEGQDGFEDKGESVELTIIRGDSSVSVARRMYEAGLVESAADFDKYLCSNGYDKSISVGTYSISKGLEYEEMAQIITRRK